MKLIDTETSLLTDKYINNLDNGYIVMGNMDLVGWVIIKKNYSWESLKNAGKPLRKLNYLCKKKQDGQMKIMFKNYFQIIIKAIDFLRELFRYHPSSFYLNLTQN